MVHLCLQKLKQRSITSGKEYAMYILLIPAVLNKATLVVLIMAYNNIHTQYSFKKVFNPLIWKVYKMNSHKREELCICKDLTMLAYSLH